MSTATDTTRENHVSAETKSSEPRRCEVTPIQKMAGKAAEGQKAAELKDKVQTVKKSLEGAATKQQQEVQQTVQQYQAAEEARAIAAKEAVKSKGREAAVETSREGGC